MSRFTQTIRLVANPYSCALDHKGRPSGLLPVMPLEIGGHRGYIGARVDPVRTKQLRAATIGDDIRSIPQDTVYEFSSEPVEISLRETGAADYYRRAIKSREAFPADASTAAWAGVKFVDPKAAIETAKHAREAEFDANYGVGALREVRDAFDQKESAAERSRLMQAEDTPQAEDSTSEKKRAQKTEEPKK